MRCTGSLSSFSGARRAFPLLAGALLLGAAGCGSVVSIESGHGGSGGSAGGTGGAGTDTDGGGAGAAAACSAERWGRGFADPYKYEYGEGIALDGACNVVVAGSFGGTMDFGGATVTGADEDLFVVKLDGAGHHIWSKAFGTEPFQGSVRVAIDEDGNILLAGTYDGTVDFGTGPLFSKQEAIYVAKLDPSGHALWARSFGGGPENEATAVAAGPDGSVLFTGMFIGSVDFGTGPLGNDSAYHPYAVQLDPDGHTKWATAFSGSGARSNGIAADANGQVVIAGSFQSSLTAGPFQLTDIGNGAFVARISPQDGSVAYAKAIGGTGQRTATAVAIDTEGFALVTGSFDNTIDLGDGPHATAGSLDGYIAAFDPNGGTYWGKTFGGPGTDSVTAIAPDSDYGAVITGAFTGTIDFDGDTLTSDGSEDGFVAFLTGSHMFGDARRFGGPTGGADIGMAVAVGPDGAQFVTGTYEGDTDFGSGPVQSGGQFDVFVAKYPR